MAWKSGQLAGNKKKINVQPGLEKKQGAVKAEFSSTGNFNKDHQRDYIILQVNA